MNAAVMSFAVSALVRVTVILAAGLLARAAMRRHSAAYRRTVLQLTVGGALVLPIAMAILPRWDVAVLPAAEPVRANAPLPVTADAADATAGSPPVGTELSPPAPAGGAIELPPRTTGAAAASVPSPQTFVLLAWLAGALTVLAWLAAGQQALRRVAREAEPLDDAAWRTLLTEEMARARVSAPVRLLVSRAVGSPATWGVRSPVIVLPEAATGWPVARRRAVLRHELAHVARRDAATWLLGAALCVTYWFHPLAWLAARALRAECESACDDDVLASGLAADEYATHLLGVAREANGHGRPAFLAVAMARRSHVGERILAILDASRPREALPAGRKRLLAGAAIAALALLAGSDLTAGEARGHGEASMSADTLRVPVFSHTEAALREAPQLELAPSPEMVVDRSTSAGENLEYVEDVALLAGGRLAGYRGIDPAVLIFGADGRLQRRIGRLGREPGTFMVPDGMLLLSGDTLFVPDLASRRINWLTPDGGFVRTAPRPAQVAGERMLDPVARLRGGWIVSHSRVLDQDVRDGVLRRPVGIVRSNELLEDARTIATMPGYEMAEITSRYRGQSRPEAVVVRFGLYSSVAGLDTLLAIATGERGAEIELRNADGVLVRRIRIERPRRPVTQAMRDSRIALELARIDGPQTERFVDIEETRRQARENPFADSLPPFMRLFATPNGTLWAVDAIAPGDREWAATAFRPDGSIVARLRAATGAMPMYFGDDRVVVRAATGDGVSFRVHRIVAGR